MKSVSEGDKHTLDSVVFIGGSRKPRKEGINPVIL
jgi:hypothetical protein